MCRMYIRLLKIEIRSPPHFQPATTSKCPAPHKLAPHQRCRGRRWHGSRSSWPPPCRLSGRPPPPPSPA
eukprot:scaffold9575_cov116-Isochrysis_galbana.AAC.2